MFDSGASHTFIHPRLLTALRLVPDLLEGPRCLLTANEQVVPCQGVVSLQLLLSTLRFSTSFVVADIGSEDIILGGVELESREAGFGPVGSGMWRMKDGQAWHLIPLVGAHAADSAVVTKVQGAKKSVKVLRRYPELIHMLEIRRVEDAAAGNGSRDAPAVEPDDVSQDRHASEARARQKNDELASMVSEAKTTSTARRWREARDEGNRLRKCIEDDNAELLPESEALFNELQQDFPQVFAEPQQLPPWRYRNHRMELLPGAKVPLSRGLPRMSHAELAETSRWVEDMLRKGWIRPSLASHAARFFFVPKPNGKGIRAVCDYRAINAVTKKILPSLPLFENVVTQVEGARYFSVVDLTNQFYQIRVNEEDIENTAFRTPIGVYEFTVTPMGTTPSVGTAMTTMEEVLQHVVSHDGEQLPANPRRLPPIPDQEGYPDTGEWKNKMYHSALGSYTTLFVDDVLIFSKTLKDHRRHLRQICDTLKEHYLFLNPKKCIICKAEVQYLGNLIGRHGVRPLPERIQALADWPAPLNFEELRSFLGLLGFCRRYIPDLAQIAVPLNRLGKTGVPWQWTETHQKAFDKLKRRCTSAPVLAIPSSTAELVLRTDASKHAMGVALFQKLEDGYLQPVEFKSKAFTPSQQRLAAHDRECLAVLFALQSFKHFLWDRPFRLQTDNSALSQILTSKDLSDLYARWYAKLALFPQMQISHRPGRKLYVEDALSRRPVMPGEDLQPFFVEPGELFVLSETPVLNARRGKAQHKIVKRPGSDYRVMVQTDAELSEADTDLDEASADKIQSDAGQSAHKETDASVQLESDNMPSNADQSVHAESLQPEPEIVEPSRLYDQSIAYESFQLSSSVLADARQQWPELYKEDEEFAQFWATDADPDHLLRWSFFKYDGLLYKEGLSGPRLCVPQKADKASILAACHDSAGHMGKNRTLARVLSKFYWKGQYSDTCLWVQTCQRCQLAKHDGRQRAGAPQVLPVPPLPWHTVHMDWITGLPTSASGFDAVLVFICQLTGMVHFQPCQKTDTARDTAKHFVHNVVRLHGMPEVLVSDRDVRLTAHFWKAVQQRLGTELRFTTRHNPNANGKVERVNMVLADVLRSLCKFSGKDWHDHLDLAEFAINGSHQSATNCTPFFANHARELPAPMDLGAPQQDVPAAAEFTDALFATLLHTRDSLERAKRKYETQLRKRRRESPKYAIGDRVLLSTKDLNLRHSARKLTCRFVGPFTVIAPQNRTGVINPNCVYLEVPSTLRIHMPVNVKSIKPYFARPAELGPVDEVPQPLHSQGRELWEVEEILAERVQKCKRKKALRQVLVKWTGFHVVDATWEPIANMPDAVVQQWRQLQQNPLRMDRE